MTGENCLAKFRMTLTRTIGGKRKSFKWNYSEWKTTVQIEHFIMPRCSRNADLKNKTICPTGAKGELLR